MNLLGKPWWRSAPLTPPEMRLLQAVATAHAASALRMNASTQAVILSASGGGEFGKALAAALLTLGDRHAPLEATCLLLNQPEPAVRASALLKAGAKVPGWGNSFHRGEPDPLWVPVDAVLRAEFPQIHRDLTAITATLHRVGLPLHPNPSAYTAATARAVGLAPSCAAYLFIAARLETWSGLIHDHLSTT